VDEGLPQEIWSEVRPLCCPLSSGNPTNLDCVLMKNVNVICVDIFSRDGEGRCSLCSDFPPAPRSRPRQPRRMSSSQFSSKFELLMMLIRFNVSGNDSFVEITMWTRSLSMSLTKAATETRRRSGIASVRFPPFPFYQNSILNVLVLNR